MRNSFTFSKSLTAVFGLLLFFTDADLIHAQQTSDGPIEASFRVRRVYARDYDDTFGGVTTAENTWLVWAQDAANLDGQGWRGGNCITFDIGAGSFPFTSGILNQTLFTQTYGSNVPTSYQIRMDAWEDDCPGGSRCSYDSGGFSCAFDGDDERCNVQNFAGNINFRNNRPGFWTNNGFFFSCGGQYGIEVESFWKRTQGNTIGDPIVIGSTNCNNLTYSQVNSNSTQAYTSTLSGGQPGADVWYQFTICQTSDVTISTCNATTDFDTYIHLANSGGTILNTSDDNCSAFPLNGLNRKSSITRTNLAPGTYYAVIEGFGSAQGVFQLDVDITPRPSPTTISGLPASICVDAAPIILSANPAGGTFSGPGITGNTFDPATAGTGTHTINYAVPNGTDYTVTPTGFGMTNHGGTSISLANNQLSGALSIGFPFCFYGTTYSNFYISSNGFISFSSNGPGCCAGQGIPNTANPDNLIALAWENLNPAAPITSSSAPRIGYGVIGTAPNRTLIVTYHEVDHAPSGNKITGQIKLFEGSNLIETHLESMPSDGGLHTQGVENSNGTRATATPGRNQANWSATNSAHRFTPPGCSGTASQTITVNPLPNANFSGLPASACINSNPVTLSPSQPGGIFSGPGINGNSFDPATASIGTHIITYTVLDGNGCTNSSTQTVDVIRSPSLSFAGLAGTYCPNASNATLTGSPSGGIFSGSGVTGNTFSPVSAGTGTFTITYTYTDGNGCTNSTAQTTTVSDTQVPTALCQSATVSLDAAGNGSLVPADIDNGSNDNCGIAARSLSQSNFTCGDLGSNTVSLTVTDIAGNTAACTATVSVIDNVAPTVTCQDITVNIPVSLTASVTPAQVTSALSDNCGITSTSVSPNSFTCADVGSAFTVTVNASDGTNSNSCSAQVTIADLNSNCNQPPVAVCQDITVNANANCQGGATATDFDGGSSDPDQDPLTFSVSPAGPYALGNTPVTLTVTDPQGASDQCSATITVQDVTAPVVTCPANITQNSDPGQCAAVVTYSATATDNCSANLTFGYSQASGTVFPVGTTSVTVTATDPSGNAATCSFTITVNDTEAPTLSCPADLTLDCANSTAPASTGTATATDNCGVNGITFTDVSSSPLPSCPQAYTLTRTWTATDVNGNSSACLQVLTIEDNVAPVAVCQDLTVQLDANGNGSVTASDVDNGSTDNCGAVTLSLTSTVFGCADVGNNTVTLSATDECGNTGTCSAVITIADNVPPMAICQDLTLQLTATGTATLLPGEVDAGSTDACGIASLSLNDSSFSCPDTTGSSVILTVTDVNGNSSNCTANITVEDTIAPIALCQDVTLSLNNLGQATLLSSAVDAGTSDNCGLSSLIVVPGVYSCVTVGMVSATLIARDISGNQSSCTALITIEDLIPPVAQCQDVTVQLDANGTGSTRALNVDNGSNDACGIATYSLDITNFTCADIGANSVVLTVTDPHGNSSSCSAIVSVEDNINPIAFCQDLTLQLNASGAANITPQMVDNGSIDACGIANLALNNLNFGCRDVSSGNITVGPTPTDLFISEYVEGTTTGDQALEFYNGTGSPIDLRAGGYAIDLYLNGAATPNLTILLSGTIANNDVFVLADNNASALVSNVADQIANFNFTGDDAVVLRRGSTTLDIFGVIGNDPGNRWVDAIQTSNGTRNQTLVREPSVTAGITTNPSGIGPNAFTTLGSEWAAQGANNFSNLGSHTYVGSLTGGGGNASSVTLTVTDVNGNQSTCNASITVEDNVAPVAVCQDITLQLDAAGTGSTTAQAVDNGSNDACGIDSLALSQTTFSCSDLGGNTATLTVFDANGNQSSCTTTLTVEDNVAPGAICQDVTVQLDASGNGATTAQTVDNGSNDACGIQSLALSQTAFVCSEAGANTVTLTVTDNSGNASTCTATVTVEDNVAPTAICQDITLTLPNSGNISLTAQDVDNGSNDACGVDTVFLDLYSFDCANQGANTVTLTVIDVNGNIATCTATVTVDIDPLEAVLTSPTYNCGYNISCFGNNDGSATATVTGGCLPYTYQWDDAGMQTTATAVNLSAGTYTVAITDNNGNTTVVPISLTQPDSLIADLGPDVVLDYGCSCVDISTVSITGGCPPYTYLWGTQETTSTITVCPKQSTFYSVTITDANGCETKDSINVIKPSLQGQTDEYVVLGVSRVDIGNGVSGISGAIGVNGNNGVLNVNPVANLNILGNSWITAQTISLSSNTTVGDVYTGTTPSFGSNATRGNILPLPAPMPVTPCSPLVPGGTNITVSNNQTVNLTPGDYGTLYIGNRGVLSLAPGVYTFTQINTAQNIDLVSVTGNGSDVAVFVAGNVAIGNNADVIANIAAPTSRVSIGNGSLVYGSIIGDVVGIGNGTVLKLEAFCWEDAPCGTNKESNVAEIESSIGDEMEILAYPNPFRISTTIQFRLPHTEQVKVEILSVTGVSVATLFEGVVTAGVQQELTFTPADKTSGIYFYRLSTQSGLVRNGKLIFQQ